MAVVTMQIVIRGIKFALIISKEVISPTPAGIKKNARWSRKNEDIVSIFSTLITLVQRSRSRIIIPIILPGTGSDKPFAIISPSK